MKFGLGYINSCTLDKRIKKLNIPMDQLLYIPRGEGYKSTDSTKIGIKRGSFYKTKMKKKEISG